MRLHGVGAVDDLWATACALHNYLLESDELDGEWNSGVAWLGVLGHHDAADVPLIFERVGGGATTDFSGMGNGGDERAGGGGFGSAAAAPAPAPVPATATPVRSLTKSEFSKRLMVHFDILWRRGEIVWPSRNGEMEMA